MEVKRPGRVQRSTRVAAAKEPPYAPTAPRKKSVSAAAVFKKPTLATRKKVQITPKKTVNLSRLTARSSSVRKPRSGSARSGSQSPHKGGHGKKSDMHPLAVAFKDSTNAYRAHLYQTATAKLDATFDTLVAQLHDRNLATISSPLNTSDPNASPMKLTISAKYERATEKVFRSIGDYTVTNHGPNNDGSVTTVRRVPLKEKITAFDASYVKEVEEIKGLEAQWENIVGEIYKTGAACLGVSAMNSLLLVTETSSPSSPLLVPEQASPTAAPKKRVTFQNPHREYPNFLYGPSMFRNHPIAELPALPEEGVRGLEDAVSKLGTKQIEELKKIEVEQSRWWNKKCEQIAQTLKAD